MATASSLALGCGPLARKTSACVPPQGRADGQGAERAERGAVGGGGGEVARLGGQWACCDRAILAGTNTKSKRNRRQIASFRTSSKCTGAKPKSGRWRGGWREGEESSLSSCLTPGHAVGNADANGVGNVTICAASGRTGDCLGIAGDEGEGRGYGGDMEDAEDEEAALLTAEMIGRMNGADEEGEKQGETERRVNSPLSAVGRRAALMMTGNLTAAIASVSSMRGSWPSWKSSSDALADEAEAEEEVLWEIVAPDEVAEQTAMELSSSSDGSEGSADLAVEANSSADTSADSSGATSPETSVEASAESSTETSVAPEYASEQPSDGPRVTAKVYLDISAEDEPLGRIVIGLYGQDAPIGAQRFTDLAAGKGGISYRRKIFDKITPSFIQNAGVRFNVSAQTADNESIAGGPSALPLIEEMKQQQNRQGGAIGNQKGSVSLVALALNREPPKQKLIAKNGKLVVVEEPGVPDPNGTEFAILREDAPELDATNIVVGRQSSSGARRMARLDDDDGGALEGSKVMTTMARQGEDNDGADDHATTAGKQQAGAGG
ncbi:hypothetical protein CBR_g48720 [Chara braunii]|uniref:PPIase cyclophilin-type domain-containing protein n=1 Tax=Chara braunii TaxID=69332 RepID=A0A388K4K7_CHABU|nr:hypothetical protein CBR_g48720 [Chara braunii]|eukprot:GBG64971.1 hypothetical protein CBR_g48720 [Chara braunii]